jgi:hypothetical protein
LTSAFFRGILITLYYNGELKIGIRKDLKGFYKGKSTEAVIAFHIALYGVERASGAL